MYIMLFQYFKDKVIENLWHQVKNIEYHVDENNEFIITRRLVLRNGRKVVKEFKRAQNVVTYGNGLMITIPKS